MSNFVLINSTRLATTFFFAGETLSDTIHPTTAIASAGGVLVATGNAGIDAAAAKCESARKYRGADAAACDSIMIAALGSASSGALAEATATTAGLMSAFDKDRFDDLGNATTSVAGLMSAADKTRFDGARAAKGTNLTDTATQTIQFTGGAWRVLPTLSQGGALTIGTTGAVAGDVITITRRATGAFAYAVINGGAGAGTMLTFPALLLGAATFQFDGTNWEMKTAGVVS